VPGNSATPFKLLLLIQIRFDYDSTSHSLSITMSLPKHEWGVQLIRHTFEPTMESLTARYGGSWKYDTNAGFCIFDDHILPTSSTRTPDGVISDHKSGMLLAVEVSSSQTVETARKKMQSFFCNPSVVVGIIINFDETPAYSSPKCSWDSDKPFVMLAEWDSMGFNAWEPMYLGGHCWGGHCHCWIEVHWPCTDGKKNLFAAVSPLYLTTNSY
jgi:hypothetical protein